MLPLLAALPLATPAAAEPVLGESHEAGTASVGIYQGLERAQNFTAGAPGRLLRVELLLSRAASPVTDVVDLDLGATEPDGRPAAGPPIALASSVSTSELSSLPEWIAFEWSGA